MHSGEREGRFHRPGHLCRMSSGVSEELMGASLARCTEPCDEKR